MQLVIVESPAKAKTIEKYLGSDYRVLASYGHVRDLPAKDGSVNPDDNFAMDWENYADKAKQLKAITDLAKTADTPDPGDRSLIARGRRSAWHVQEVLREAARRCPRTCSASPSMRSPRQAVTEAMKHPRESGRGSDRRVPRAPGARLSGRLYALPRAVAQAARRQIGRPRPVGGAAADGRPRARDRSVHRAGILVGRRAAWNMTARRSSRGSCKPQGRQDRPADDRKRMLTP